jgi:DNA polymerase-3 subunit gamma/tau
VFENLLAQEAVAATLRADIEADKLPPSLLFTGPAASGKLTAALELARVLSCEAGPGEERAPWACACPACSRHRVLAHPDLLLLGPRSFPEEIPAALDLIERSPGRAGAYFFVRAVRKLGKRFDAALYEGEETRLAKALPLLREIEERLDAVAPEKATGTSLAPGALEAARAATAASRKLEGFVPDAPPVFQVRSLEVWARLAPWGKAKTLVIENAERMQDSARNALLKILEEPPRSLRFILLSARPTAIIRTVLSRVRPYAFAPRDAAGSALVLERVFRSGPVTGAASLGAFLEAMRPFPPEAARARAAAFLAEAIERRLSAGRADGREDPARGDPALLARIRAEDAPPALPALLEATKEFGQRDEAYAESFGQFLRALSAETGAILRDPRLSPGGASLLESWSRLYREAGSRRASINLSASLLAEGLLSAMGEA